MNSNFELIIKGLSRAFGDRALEVARRQQGLATGDARKSWSLIVARLEKLQSDES
jgi:hypothetical protein